MRLNASFNLTRLLSDLVKGRPIRLSKYIYVNASQRLK